MIHAKYKEFKIIENFKHFIINKSNEVFNEKLNENDINEKNNKLKSEHQITPKSIKIDVLDMLKFIEVKYGPQYFYYIDKENNQLIIKIQTNSKCENIQAKYIILEEQIKFTIKGHKLCQEKNTPKKKKTIVLFNEKRKENDFEIEFIIERNKISYLKEVNKSQEKGFYILTYTINN